MELYSVLKKNAGSVLENYPDIRHSNLYKKVIDNFYFEFVSGDEKYLFSPLYVVLRGNPPGEFKDFVSQNNSFLDSVKIYILNSLFVYSAIIEENAYYISNPHNIIIARLIPRQEDQLEIKFYSHLEDELQNSYNDKIYIGRDFISLKDFYRKYLGLKSVYLAFIDQNYKIQERAKQKLRYYDDYKKPYLDEIDYSIKEMVSDSMERIELIPETRISEISTVKLVEALDNVIYLQNLMTELRESTREFENKLRLNNEINFAKYLTKFSKDLKNDILYLRKLSTYIHLRISNFSISKC